MLILTQFINLFPIFNERIYNGFTSLKHKFKKIILWQIKNNNNILFYLVFFSRINQIFYLKFCCCCVVYTFKYKLIVIQKLVEALVYIV